MWNAIKLNNKTLNRRYCLESAKKPEIMAINVNKLGRLIQLCAMQVTKLQFQGTLVIPIIMFLSLSAPKVITFN